MITYCDDLVARTFKYYPFRWWNHVTITIHKRKYALLVLTNMVNIKQRCWVAIYIRWYIVPMIIGPYQGVEIFFIPKTPLSRNHDSVLQNAHQNRDFFFYTPVFISPQFYFYPSPFLCGIFYPSPYLSYLLLHLFFFFFYFVSSISLLFTHGH